MVNCQQSERTAGHQPSDESAFCQEYYKTTKLHWAGLELVMVEMEEI